MEQRKRFAEHAAVEFAQPVSPAEHAVCLRLGAVLGPAAGDGSPYHAAVSTEQAPSPAGQQVSPREHAGHEAEQPTSDQSPHPIGTRDADVPRCNRDPGRRKPESGRQQPSSDEEQRDVTGSQGEISELQYDVIG